MSNIATVVIDTNNIANFYVRRLLKLIAENSSCKATCYDAYGREVEQ